ncbi:MAG: hypothetical protein IPL15_23370 [Comamonadaceae bacterium]|uniref:hypothetical protein n=1 Tax=Candidatus Skiveiella danica TaxID=3386177 RepID=UPI003908C372|nr:hypothetical protein [Comamonadaceae bacterium]
MPRAERRAGFGPTRADGEAGGVGAREVALPAFWALDGLCGDRCEHRTRRWVSSGWAFGDPDATAGAAASRAGPVMARRFSDQAAERVVFALVEAWASVNAGNGSRP